MQIFAQMLISDSDLALLGFVNVAHVLLLLGLALLIVRRAFRKEYIYLLPTMACMHVGFYLLLNTLGLKEYHIGEMQNTVLEVRVKTPLLSYYPFTVLEEYYLTIKISPGTSHQGNDPSAYGS